jgi:hypothetical protein
MRILRIAVVSLLIVSLSAPAFAGDLAASIAKAAQQQAKSEHASMPKEYLWCGTLLFAGGIGAALYGYLHNEHTGYPEFGEATATNVKLGSAGIVTAFAGGTILFLGVRRAQRSPAITVGPGKVTVSKQITW